MEIATKIEYFKKPLRLESGRILEEYKLCYETYGTLNSDKSNVIVVCHALTGSHHAAGFYKNDKKPGWWDGMIGDEKCIDTKEYFVICVNIIGSPFGSTSAMSKRPNSNKKYKLNFPVITISDIVKAQINLFKKLNIYHVKAIIGGSLGGMQALCFAIEYPDFADEIISLASTYATNPWAIAFNKIAMEAIINDPKFQDGNYDENEVINGLVYGRMAGHISFLNPNSMIRKFDRAYVSTDGLYELFGRFQVEGYLEYNAYNFAKRFDALSYLYIVKAMNIFDASRNYESLEDSLNNIKANLTLISFSGDLLFLPQEMRHIYEVLCKIGKKDIVKYHEINSDYGHDAFLVELDKFSYIIKNILTKE